MWNGKSKAVTFSFDDGEDRLFYIWGHAYELDGENGISWEKFEKFCRLISDKPNVFYGTNKEVLL